MRSDDGSHHGLLEQSGDLQTSASAHTLQHPLIQGHGITVSTIICGKLFLSHPPSGLSGKLLVKRVSESLFCFCINLIPGSTACNFLAMELREAPSISQIILPLEVFVIKQSLTAIWQ